VARRLELISFSEISGILDYRLTRAKAICFPSSCGPLLGTFEAKVWSRVAAAWIRQLKYIQNFQIEMNEDGNKSYVDVRP